jgi:hypothetical protein
MEELVDERLQAILAQPFETLATVPECVEEQLSVNGKPVKLTTYHQVLEMGAHRLIVQAIRERWGGVTAKVVARGYEVSAGRGHRKLSEEELYDYT